MQSPGRYLYAQLTRVADILSRPRLRLSVTGASFIRPTRLVTVGDRVFPVVAPKLWNDFTGDALLPGLWRLSVVTIQLFHVVYHIRFHNL